MKRSSRLRSISACSSSSHHSRPTTRRGHMIHRPTTTLVVAGIGLHAGRIAAARTPGTAEAAVELNFTKARAVPVPAVDPDDQHVHRDDLRALWALHQGAHFAMLETQVLDFHFYSFAREATGRKYGVVAPAWVRRQVSNPEHRLYEITTGADALSE